MTTRRSHYALLSQFTANTIPKAKLSSRSKQTQQPGPDHVSVCASQVCVVFLECFILASRLTKQANSINNHTLCTTRLIDPRNKVNHASYSSHGHDNVSNQRQRVDDICCIPIHYQMIPFHYQSVLQSGHHGIKTIENTHFIAGSVQ